MKLSLKFIVCTVSFLIILTSTWFSYCSLTMISIQPSFSDAPTEFTNISKTESTNPSAVDLVSSSVREITSLNEEDADDCFRSRQYSTPAKVSSTPYINLGFPKMGELSFK
jgi:hypothetical protein